MGYTVKQKIDICLQSESRPEMTQADLAKWAQEAFNSKSQPSQTTISRILSSKNELIASKQADFSLIRRRKAQNPILRHILTEWVTQCTWENIPITTPIIKSTANSIWTRLPLEVKDGNGVFNQKWCNQFIRKLNINLTGDPDDIQDNMGYKLNKIWFLDEKVELKQYLRNMIEAHHYKPEDIFTLEEFQLFYSLPLDQIFDMNSVDKGIKQSSSSSEASLTIMLGTNLVGTEKLTPMIVGKPDKFDVSKSSVNSLKNFHSHSNDASHSVLNLMNKITETYRISYKSNINKWITSTMFQNYLLTLEQKLANSDSNRKILIIVDDSSTHRILNLKFNNIRLVFLKNNTNHKSPFNSLHNGVNFDYCPMNFGIVHEFKTLYRLQQYLDMINIQKNFQNKSGKPTPISIDNFKLNSNAASSDVLSEAEYNVPLIKAIEWVKRAWDSVSKEKIMYSWNRTHLINMKQVWPQNPELHAALLDPKHPKLTRSYMKLNEVMKYLNVVLPWDIDELLGLVNERVKATLNYISIEEIVASCLSESDPNSEQTIHSQDHQAHDFSDTFQTLDELNSDDWLMNQLLSQPTGNLKPELSNTFDIDNSSTNILNYKGQSKAPDPDTNSQMSINALLAAADETNQLESQNSSYQNGKHLPNIPQTNMTQNLKQKLLQEDIQNPGSTLQGPPRKKQHYTRSPLPFPPDNNQAQLNDSLPSSSGSSPYNGPISFPSNLYSRVTFKSPSVSNLSLCDKTVTEEDIIKSIKTLLRAIKTNSITVSPETYNELKSHLSSHRGINGDSS